MTPVSVVMESASKPLTAINAHALRVSMESDVNMVGNLSLDTVNTFVMTMKV